MPDIYGPDITEEEARKTLAEALGCKPGDIKISHSWLVITPHGEGYLRESAGQLKQSVARILVRAEEPR